MRAAVQNLVSSFFSPTKRPREEQTADDSSSLGNTGEYRRKRSRRRSSSDVPSHLEALERLQSRLLQLDEECTKEQMIIQKKFDEQKFPIWNERKSFINQIPDFWATAIGNHPVTKHEKFFWNNDFQILSFLIDIDLRDNIDDFGSYEIIFSFDSDRNIFFSESQVTRTVSINKNGDENVNITPITWAPGKRPKSKKSFFHWLSSKQVLNDDDDDVGEIFRTDLWQNPYPYFLNLSPEELADIAAIRSSTVDEVAVEERDTESVVGSSISSD